MEMYGDCNLVIAISVHREQFKALGVIKLWIDLY